MKVAILGFGNVGRQTARIMADAEQEVIVATRTGKADNCNFPVMNFEEAISEADAVLIAIHYSSVEQTLSPFTDALVGKIIIDATNPLNEDWSPLLLGEENSAGEVIQRLFNQSQVVKAFNTIFADVMGQKDRKNFSHPLAAFVASDHPSAKQWMLEIMKKAQFEAIDVGPIKMARYLEAMANLNIQIAVGQNGGTKAGFAYSS
ncbi:NADPH-dependent F420 reductase [Vibrio sp. VNB-15]